MSHFLPCSRSLSWLWLVFWATQSLVLTVPLRAGDVDQLPADAWRLPSDSGLVPGKLFESLQVAYDGPSRAYVPWRYGSYFNFDLLFGVLVPLEDREDFDVGAMIGGRFEGRVFDNFRLGFELDGGFNDISS